MHMKKNRAFNIYEFQLMKLSRHLTLHFQAFLLQEKVFIENILKKLQNSKKISRL